MNYGSICSGVEAASLAWRHLGWTPAFFSEVEPFPAAVLMQRLGATRPLRPLDPEAAPDEKDRKQRLSWQSLIAELPDGGTIPNLGDFTLIKKDDYDGQINLLVGGPFDLAVNNSDIFRVPERIFTEQIGIFNNDIFAPIKEVVTI